MATLKQFEFFRFLYDEENERTKQLADRAKTYLSLSTFYSAFVIFVVEKLRPDTPLSKLLFVGSIFCMLATFFLSLLATRVSSFELATDPETVVEQFGDDSMADEEFFDNRIADYTVAHERNSDVNDRKANQMAAAGYAMLVGILLHACYLFVRIACGES